MVILGRLGFFVFGFLAGVLWHYARVRRVRSYFHAARAHHREAAARCERAQERLDAATAASRALWADVRKAVNRLYEVLNVGHV